MTTQRPESRFLARIVAPWLVCGILVCMPSCAYFHQDEITFKRSPTPTTQTSKFAAYVARYRIHFGAKRWERGGYVEAWFIPAPGATAAHRAPVAVCCHGTCPSIAYMDDDVEGFRALGFSVLLPEYRGYGHSDGQPSQETITRDTAQFYDMIAARPDVDPTRMVFHGDSLGGAVAAQLAARRKPAALILVSTFTRTAYFPLANGLPPALEFVVRNPFHTDEVVAKLDRPILIFHGRRDETVSVTEGRKLHALAKNSTYVEYDCTHVLPDDQTRQDYWAQISKFLKKSGILKGS